MTTDGHQNTPTRPPPRPWSVVGGAGPDAGGLGGLKYSDICEKDVWRHCASTMADMAAMAAPRYLTTAGSYLHVPDAPWDIGTDSLSVSGTHCVVGQCWTSLSHFDNFVTHLA